MRDDIEIIVKRIESTNIKHRFNRQIYLKFIDYIESEDNDLYNWFADIVVKRQHIRGEK